MGTKLYSASRFTKIKKIIYKTRKPSSQQAITFNAPMQSKPQFLFNNITHNSYYINNTAHYLNVSNLKYGVEKI